MNAQRQDNPPVEPEEKKPPGASARKKILLFVFFGIPGFYFFFISSTLFSFYLIDGKEGVGHLVLALAVCVASSLLCLIGAGKWRQWLYLLVFYSYPAALVLGSKIEKALGLDLTKIGPVLWVLLFMVVTNFLVKRHYEDSSGES